MSVAFHQLDKQTHDEYACTFAALLLYDEGIEITADKIKKLVEASGNKVEGYWPGLFAKALHGRNVADLLSGGAAPAPAGGATTATTGGAPAKPAEAAKKEEKKPEKEEEPDVGLGGGLFGDDDDF